MIEFINTKYGLPLKFCAYFCKIEGVKYILSYEEVCIKAEKGYEVLWLNEHGAQNIGDPVRVKSVFDLVEIEQKAKVRYSPMVDPKNETTIRRNINTRTFS